MHAVANAKDLKPLSNKISPSGRDDRQVNWTAVHCIIHEVRRNSDSIATNFEKNTTHFSQLEIIRLIQNTPGYTLNKYAYNSTEKKAQSVHKIYTINHLYSAY